MLGCRPGYHAVMHAPGTIIHAASDGSDGFQAACRMHEPYGFQSACWLKVLLVGFFKRKILLLGG
jgi:hypothetical protein